MYAAKKKKINFSFKESWKLPLDGDGEKQIHMTKITKVHKSHKIENSQKSPNWKSTKNHQIHKKKWKKKSPNSRN